MRRDEHDAPDAQELAAALTAAAGSAAAVQDSSGTWSPASQWSSWIGSPTGIYVIFDGHNAQSPSVLGVRAIRLVGVNGTTAMLVGMMNLTPH